MADAVASGAFSAAWNGVGTAPVGSVLQVTVGDNASAGIEIEVPSAFVGTIVVEGTISGNTWFTPNCLTLAKAAGPTSFSGAGRTFAQTEAFTALRLRCSAFTSGLANGTIAQSVAGV